MFDLFILFLYQNQKNIMSKSKWSVSILVLMMAFFFTSSCEKQDNGGGNNNRVPKGALKGKFTVGENKQVYFSKGSLQYIGSANNPYWKFADNQWDYIGEVYLPDNPYTLDTSRNVDRDLFAWGTSGYAHGAVYYQPWSTSENDDDYFAYGDPQMTLADCSGRADWGYNPIVNGGNITGFWRTLTVEEWQYIVRNTGSVIATVNDVRGYVLFPDDCDVDIYELGYDNHYGFPSPFTIEEWETVFEDKGCVFLPWGIPWMSTVPGIWLLGNADLFERHEHRVVRLVCPVE